MELEEAGIDLWINTGMKSLRIHFMNLGLNRSIQATASSETTRYIHIDSREVVKELKTWTGLNMDQHW